MGGQVKDGPALSEVSPSPGQVPGRWPGDQKQAYPGQMPGRRPGNQKQPSPGQMPGRRPQQKPGRMPLRPPVSGGGTGNAVRARPEEIKLLARLMLAEAENQGPYGMLLVGNVGVNRVLSDCFIFKKIRSITDMVFQNPGGFQSVKMPLFYTKRPTKQIERLAEQVTRGLRYDPATTALWFYRPSTGQYCYFTWFNQLGRGAFKEHCFYGPYPTDCPAIFVT